MKRKPNNMRARAERVCRAVLRQNNVAVVNIDPSGRQGLINWKNCKSIRPGPAIADAVCDYPHAWCIYMSALCLDQDGHRYIKSIEVAPKGQYLVTQINELIEVYYPELLDGCNQKHIHASAWIAIPDDVTLDEEQAARIYDAVNAWEVR